MKLRKLFPVLVICILFLVACAPAQGFAQKVVELPSPLQIFILSSVTFLVGFTFSKIAEAIPWLAKILGQYVDQVSVALGGAVVLAVQNWLHAIPPEWEGVANAALALLVAILAGYSILKSVKRVAAMAAARLAKN